MVCVISEKKAVKSLFASDSQNSDNADELLGLCSGQFSGAGAPWRDPSTAANVHRGLFTPYSTNNDCLLDVLSGQFTSTRDDHYASRSACWISVCCHLAQWLNLSRKSPFPLSSNRHHQIGIIVAMVIVWRVRGKIIRSVLCSVVYNSYAQCKPNSCLLVRFSFFLGLYCVLQFICVRFSFLVHGQVTIIFVVSVGLSVCLFVCAEFFSAVFDPILIKLGHMLYVWV